VEGLKSGQADLDGDGFICTHELYNYVLNRIRSEDPAQRPLEYALVHGRLWVARAPERSEAVPREILDYLDNSKPRWRRTALEELGELLQERGEKLYPAASLILEKMSSDADNGVQRLAQSLLANANENHRERITQRRFAGESWEKDEKTINDYAEAIRLKPNDTELYNTRGNEYCTKGDYDKAISDYTQAIRLNREFAVVSYNRGNAYSDIAKYDQAINDYTEAIRLEPRQGEQIRIRMANCGVDVKKDLEPGNEAQIHDSKLAIRNS
jgi:tetratricopeptide (TPR) repeat protein